MSTSFPRRALAAAAAVLAIGAVLLSFSGRVGYVTTRGDSMEPALRSGDVAIVRAADDYAVGDAVAYRSERLRATVLHRIVGVEGDRFVLKGDNNPWHDPDRPTRDQLVGRLALRVPHGGAWLGVATGPAARAAVVFLLVTGAASAATVRPSRRRRTMGHHRTGSSAAVGALSSLPPALRLVAAATGAAAVAGAVLAAATWTSPTTDRRTAPASRRAVTFSYAASVGSTPAYDSATAKAPDPVFRKLADDVDLTFRYEGAPGTVRVDAELSSPSGWHSTVRLAPERTVATSPYEATVRLDLAALTARAQAAGTATGIPNDQIDVTVVPRFAFADGTTYEPELPLVLTPLQLKLEDPNALTNSGFTPAAATTPVPRTVGVLGRRLDAATGRQVSAALLLLAGLGAAALLLLARRSARTDATAAVRRRYAALLLPVRPVDLPISPAPVEVTDLATLAKLAERYGLLVLHWTDGDVTTYVVRDDATTYRYRSGHRAERRAA